MFFFWFSGKFADSSPLPDFCVTVYSSRTSIANPDSDFSAGSGSLCVVLFLDLNSHSNAIVCKSVT